MPKIKVEDILRNGVIASAYFIFTIINPLSFGPIQFRIAEILCLLCFYRPTYFIGVTIGCVLSNIVSKLGFIDIFVGGGATLLCCLFIGYVSNRLWLCCLFMVITNGLAIGWEIFYFMELPFFASALTVSLGELSVVTVGYFVFYLLRNRKDLLKLISANKHLEWKW